MHCKVVWSFRECAQACNVWICPVYLRTGGSDTCHRNLVEFLIADTCGGKGSSRRTDVEEDQAAALQSDTHCPVTYWRGVGVLCTEGNLINNPEQNTRTVDAVPFLLMYKMSKQVASASLSLVSNPEMSQEWEPVICGLARGAIKPCISSKYDRHWQTD